MNHSPHNQQHEIESRSRWEHPFESWLAAHINSAALLVVAAGFLIRLRAASGTFLNPDEALHYLLANQSSWQLAYKASLTNAHPPLLTFVLYYWRVLGDSELALRLPSVFAGTAFCWIVFKWLTRIFGQATGFIGLILVTFLPPLIGLTAEVRQYALLLLFLASAACWLERALEEDSPAMMLLSEIFVCFGMLTHYSAILFAAAMGIYSLVRIVTHRPAAKVFAAWALGQAGAVVLFVFLYSTHISQMKGDYASGTINGWLGNSFFHPGRDNPLLFIIARSGGVFQYVFGQLAVGDIAFIGFVAAIVLLSRAKVSPAGSQIAAWQLGILLVLPFALAAGASLARLYPYGGTRHSAFLIMFAAAGVSFLLARLLRQRIGRGIVLSLLVVAVCSAFGKPHRPYMLPEDQSRAQMIHAIGFVRSQIPQSDLIFADYQTRLLLAHYLCPEQPMLFSSSAASLEEFQCSGYQIVAAGPEEFIFTEETFPRWRDELLQYHPLMTGQSVWIIQAGWEVYLAHDFQTKFPQLNPQSFGRNITIFKLTAEQMGRGIATQSNLNSG
jgi:hypothetical protein